jgi:type III secretion protein L
MGLVFLIDRPGYRLVSDCKVLKRNEASVIEQLTQAYVRAQGEINAALANLDRACVKATEDAYRKGLAKAECEAAQRWTLGQVERLALLESLRPTLAEMVVEAIGLLAKDIDRQAFMARALELVGASLRAAGSGRLHVHPDAVRAAEVALEEFDRDTGLGRLARVIADDSLPPDGCVLESELGRVDASLATQLQAIRTAIAQATHAMAEARESRGAVP